MRIFLNLSLLNYRTQPLVKVKILLNFINHFLKFAIVALVSVGPLVGRHPVHLKVASLIPSQSTCPSCRQITLELSYRRFSLKNQETIL